MRIFLSLILVAALLLGGCTATVTVRADTSVPNPREVDSHRAGPPYALGLQLQHRGYPVSNTGRCSFRFAVGDALDTGQSYTVWNTAQPGARPIGSATHTRYGWALPFDVRGGAQVALGRREYRRLADRTSIKLRFWRQNPYGSGLLLVSEYVAQLQQPPQTGLLLAARVAVPDQCFAGRG